jgi:hypothetical protein
VPLAPLLRDDQVSRAAATPHSSSIGPRSASNESTRFILRVSIGHHRRRTFGRPSSGDRRRAHRLLLGLCLLEAFFTPSSVSGCAMAKTRARSAPSASFTRMPGGGFAFDVPCASTLAALPRAGAAACGKSRRFELLSPRSIHQS